MIFTILAFVFSYLIALGEAATYTFNVVSLNNKYVGLGVQYNGIFAPLQATDFPLFTGTVEADSITQYKYVTYDLNTNEITEIEKIDRTYSEDTPKINEVFNRTNKDVKIPELPQPFREMFPMGCESFKPFANNMIYNVYAECNPELYAAVTTEPFLDGNTPNKNEVPCAITIVTPKKVFKGQGNLHIIGYGSRRYKKVSWGMKMEDKFQGRKSIKLRALASDPTLIREKLSTELYNAVGVPVQEGTYARLIINDDVYGLYSIVDNLSAKWIAAYVHGNDKAEIGIAYKIYSSGNLPDLRYLGEDPAQYTSYQIDEYEDYNVDISDPNSVYSHIINFTKLFDNWVTTYKNDQSETAIIELEKFLNLESLLRMLVIDALVLAMDNFWLTGTNAALYYNPENKNYQFLPYDFDQTLVGSKGVQKLDPDNYISDCETWTNYNEAGTIDHYFTKSLLNNAIIRDRYEVILAKVSRETFSADVVSNYVHAVADLIDEDVEWNFNLIDSLGIPYDGQVNYYTYEEFKKNLDYDPVDYQDLHKDDAPWGIKQWVETRGQYCRDFTSAVDISVDESSSSESPKIVSFLFTIVYIFILVFLF